MTKTPPVVPADLHYRSPRGNVELFVDGRSIYLRAAYSHPLSVEARNRGFRWKREYEALASGKNENKAWAEQAVRELCEFQVADMEAAETRVPLACAYDDREIAKEHGARWDRDAKQWTIDPGQHAAAQAAIDAAKAERLAGRKAEQAQRASTRNASGPKLASDKQKSIIRRCRDRGGWFDAFDGASPYHAINGPTDNEIDAMTSREASGLIGWIMSERD